MFIIYKPFAAHDHYGYDWDFIDLLLDMRRAYEERERRLQDFQAVLKRLKSE